MSEITICPYCNAKLRIAAASRRVRNRVKCRVCKNQFHPSQVQVSGQVLSLNDPLFPPSEPVEAAESDSDQELEPVPKADAPSAPKAMLSPTMMATSPNATEDPDEPAPELRERRHHRSRGEHRRSSGSRRRHSNRKQVGTVLIAMLLLCGVAAAAIAAWSYVRDMFVAKPPPVVLSDPPSSQPAEDLKAERAVLRQYGNRGTSRIVGIWDIRGDDDRHGWYEFREDGTLNSNAWVGDQQTKPTRTNFFIVRESGDDLELEIGPESGAIGNMRMTLMMTSPNAFTITQVINNGVRQNDVNRFVRRGKAMP